MLTTVQAAERLGVSTGRIRQLINEGRLVALKTSRGWLVSEESLELRKGSAKPGRPKRGKAPEQVLRFTLMAADHEVAKIAYSRHEDAFVQVAVGDSERLPFAFKNSSRGEESALHILNDWWRGRCVPQDRAGVEQVLTERGCGSVGSFAVSGLGVSLADAYWIKPEGSGLRWDSVADTGLDFSPDSSEGLWQAALEVGCPNITAPGTLQKCWIREAGRVVLLKSGGADGREALAEAVATSLYRRLLNAGEYVEYKTVLLQGSLASVCACFVARHEEFVSAADVLASTRKRRRGNAFSRYADRCIELLVPRAVDMVQKMIVTDFLLANTQRSWSDFGVVRDLETLELRPAPLFDAGASLGARIPVLQLTGQGLPTSAMPFESDAFKQLDLVIDTRWLHLDALDGFADEVHRMVRRGCPQHPSVADVVCTGVEERIRYLKEWQAKKPHPVVVKWDGAYQKETMEYVTL